MNLKKRVKYVRSGVTVSNCKFPMRMNKNKRSKKIKKNKKKRRKWINKRKIW